jgi:hypothetical protein
MRLYSARLQVFWAIIKVRRAIVSHDASSSRSSSKEARGYAGGQIYAWCRKMLIGHESTGGGWSGSVKVFTARHRGLRVLVGVFVYTLARVKARGGRGVYTV